MPQLVIILGIYAVITLVSVFLFKAYLNANKKQILQYDCLRTQLRREVRADLIQTLHPLSLLPNKNNHQLWVNASHRLDIHSQLDHEIIHNGEYIVSQLYNWATIKQLIDSNQVRIDYTTDFALSKISPEASILISTLAIFYFSSIEDGEELNLSIEIENNTVISKFSVQEDKSIALLMKKFTNLIQEQKGKIKENKNVTTITFNQ
jgi:hypothetical protein